MVQGITRKEIIMKKILISIILLGIVGSAVGFYLFNKPLESTKILKTDFIINAVDLLNAFENDEMQANQKFLDKVIEVKGNIQKIEVKNSKTTVYLDADNLMSSVIFQLEDQASNLKKGQEVTLKGICTGYLMDVVLVRAVKV